MERTPDAILNELLVLRAQGGDERAFAALVDRWQRPLLRHALHLTERADAAADVVQETWLAAARGLRRLDDPACFPRWIMQIVSRKAPDWVRGRQRERKLVGPLTEDCRETVPPPGLAGDDDIAQLRDCIRRMPAERRMLLSMVYLNKYVHRRGGGSACRPGGYGQVAPVLCAPRAETNHRTEPHMNAFDKNIRAAMAAEETDMLRGIDEPPLAEQVIETFRGRSRWLVRLAVLIVIGWGTFAVVSAIQFSRAEEAHDMIFWAGGVGLGFMAAALTKIWYWMELNKYVMTREVKRLELQVARLADLLAKTR